VVGLAVLVISAAAATMLSLLAHARGTAPARPSLSFRLRVVDERARPLAGAVFSAGGKQWRTAGSGTAEIEEAAGVLAGPVQLPGYLDEPVVAGSESDGRTVTVRLWASRGGRRLSYHAAGDVMLGRRYLRPRAGAETARLEADRLGESARAIVAEVAPIFAAANVSTVNLETVVGNLPQSAAYPGKDILIGTPRAALAALNMLGVDAALGANNHVRDYGDAGIASTRRAVEASGIIYGGAGVDERQAARPIKLGSRRGRLVVLSFCGVTGDGVNDAYSEQRAVGPRWLRVSRTWGYAEGGHELVPARPRTIGRAWRAFRALEDETPVLGRRAWPSLSKAYPQLQDWVARRGHGGANPWDPDRSTAAIRAAAAGPGAVVVQLQRGFQYAPAPPVRLIETAHAAVDAGADIVIAHHPHVLQGLEWYRGKLIAYSIGNFVFDQDQLVTYPGGFLRTVWDRDRLLEARFVPTMLTGYRPLPVAGTTAQRLLRDVVAASLLPARSSRRGSERTRLVPRRRRPTDLVGARLEHNTLRVLRGPRGTSTELLDLRPGGTKPLSRVRLYDWGRGMARRGLLAGRDLFRYGSFDDEVAGRGDGTLHWHFGSAASWEAERGNGYLVLRRSSTSRERALARPVSRIPIAEPMLAQWRTAAHELRFRARFRGNGVPSIWLDLYRFDAGGLSIETASERLGRRRLRLDLTPDGRWHRLGIAIAVPREVDDVLPYFVLEPGDRASSLALDDVELVEWQRPGGHVYPQAFDYLRNVSRTPIRAALVAHDLERSPPRFG
jgi:poly-gamma-glutamate capsule biosynthesis protein CapA/YwtB (metallophosphatase superfamily)